MTHPLRRFRERKAITLDQLAERAGLSKSSVSRIETGRQATTETSIRKLIAATEGELTANDFIAARPDAAA